MFAIDQTRAFSSDTYDLPLAQFNKLSTTDIDLVHDYMTTVFCEHALKIDGGIQPIDFRHNLAALNDITFNAIDYGNRYNKITIDIPPMSKIYLLQFSLSGTARIAQNDTSFELKPLQMCLLDPDSEIRQTFMPGYKHFTMKVSKDDLNEALARELGFKKPDVKFASGAVELKGVARSLAHLIWTICDDINSDSAAYGHFRARMAAEHMLLRMVLAAVPHSHSHAFDETPCAVAPYYVRRVEEFVCANLTRPISLTDMIEASGVSARSLHAAFRQFRDTTPMRYLKDTRLARAHAMLKRASGDALTITDVALECGFTHLSKFSRDYFEKYGELPSCTLRNRH